MLSPKEKDDLKKYDTLDSMKRAKFHYRVGKKIKVRLSELDEIDDTINALPPKITKTLIDEDVVQMLFRLTEDILEILKYSPIQYDQDNKPFIFKSYPKVDPSDRSIKYHMEMDPATQLEVDRTYQLKNHIEKLQKFVSPPSFSNVPQAITETHNNGQNIA